MTQAFFNVFLIISLLIPQQGFAKCRKNEGLWLKSDGDIVCKKCPTGNDIVDGRALKVPATCIAPVSGALMDTSLFTYYRQQDAYALELEEFKNKLSPSLAKLTAQLETQLTSLKAANERRKTLLKSVEDLRLENTKLSTQKTIYFYSAIGLSTTLVLLTYAHFQFGH
tara:strand:+ start:1807 stop:2310 length:504 start_codon:yes stop_codon:yes gene_type:complete